MPFTQRSAIGAAVIGSLLTGVSAHGHMSGVVGKGSNAGKPYPMHKLGGFFPDVGMTDCRDCTLGGPGPDGYDQNHASAFNNGTKVNGDEYYMYKDTGLLQCHGKPKGKSMFNLAAGETIEVAWDFVINHPGPSALYMSFDGDKTWVLLSQVTDAFIKYNPGNTDIWDSSQENGMTLVQKITLPANLPASNQATLRGEWLNTQAPEFYSSCIDITTTGPGKIPTDGFEIKGTSDGPSHLSGLIANGGTPYPSYPEKTDVTKNGVTFDNYVKDIWQGKLKGPKIYDFGKNDFAFNVEMSNNKTNYPEHLYISTQNPASATPASGPAPTGAAPVTTGPVTLPSSKPTTLATVVKSTTKPADATTPAPAPTPKPTQGGGDDDTCDYEEEGKW